MGGLKLDLFSEFCFAPKLAPKGPLGLNMGRICPEKPKGSESGLKTFPKSKKRVIFQFFKISKKNENQPPIQKTPPQLGSCEPPIILTLSGAPPRRRQRPGAPRPDAGAWAEEADESPGLAAGKYRKQKEKHKILEILENPKQIYYFPIFSQFLLYVLIFFDSFQPLS